MREEGSKKAWMVVLAILASLSAAFLSTDDVVEASRVSAVPLEKAGSVEQRVGSNPPPEVELEQVAEDQLVAFYTRQQIVEAPWAPGVTLTDDGNEFRFRSDGLPNHEFPDAYLQPGELGFGQPLEWRTPSEEFVVAPIVESIVDQTITLRPAIAREFTPSPVGVIGVLIGGTQIVNDEQVDQFEQLGTLQTGFVDACNGHPAALEGQTDVVGNYHYHAVPRCSTDAVDIEGQHSSLIGVMIDGFPVYGSNDTGGESVRSSDLDECSGHFGATPEFPDGIYHYHFVDRIQASPFPCLAGVIELGSRTAEANPDSAPLARSNG